MGDDPGVNWDSVDMVDDSGMNWDSIDIMSDSNVNWYNGGLVAIATTFYSNLYWDKELSGVTTSAGSPAQNGKITEEMKMESTYEYTFTKIAAKANGNAVRNNHRAPCWMYILLS